MTWFFRKKNTETSKLNLDTIEQIAHESNKRGKEQVLFATIKRNVSGRGEVLVGFQDKTPLDNGLVRYETKEIETQLGKGEFKFQEGKFYFYPNVDIEWHPTPKKNIHKIVSNYDFSNDSFYLEPKDYGNLQSELSKCFQEESVESVFLNGNICQLEITDLDSEKELRISEALLDYLSSFYLSPFSKPQNHQ
ncbi:hypothetical protein [Leptospira jelokensis]|uniref:hypothetical protein n=1 Tax=Leptospira jelokensis TaxID=2484931 RepID=UPI00109146CD|nr:hypothetical protein [Leptospira jelokensis]TGL99414.1 hypothetical protein EHQ79_16580 [Leptospira jelokensis]